MISDHPTPSPDEISAGLPVRSMATPWFSLVACFLPLAGSVVAVFLAGGTLQGSLGLFLVGAGVPMILCPPRLKVDWRLWVAGAGLLCCGGLAFLPARWLPQPPWRVTLEKESIVPLPTTVSTEPWTTAFWLGVLAISILVGLFLLAHPLRSKWLLRGALFAVLASGAYAALAIYAKRSGWHYPFEARATFGFFPNRNHTATFLVTGSILALAVLTVGLRDRRWLSAALAAAALSTCLVALFFYSGSRAGVIFVLIGCLTWVAGLGRGHLNFRLLVSFAALLIAGTVLFLTTQSEVRSRLFAAREAAPQATAPANPFAEADRSETKTPPFDFRVLIYRDTLHLIRDYPLTGAGLGCFSLVFPQYRHASLSEATAIHPESDWLMLIAEAGIPAFLCLLVLIAFLGQRLRPLRDHPFWPLRWGCIAAGLTTALHGIVDVPAHRVELGWWVLLMIGLGLQINVDRRAACSRFQHLFFVAGGLAAFILGAGLIRAEWFGGKPLPPFKAGKAEDDIFKAYQHQDFAGATKLAQEAIRDSPMFEPLYFQWGALLAQTETDDAASDASFKAQRFLNPYLPSIPLRQGEVWMNDDPGRTAAFWREALERRERMNQATSSGPEASLDFYRDLVRHSAGKPTLERNLLNLAGQRPTYILAWFENTTPEVSKEQVGALAGNNGFLENLNEAERVRFLKRWHVVGDRTALQSFVQGRTDWQEAAWFIWIRQLIDDQRFEEAVRRVATRYLVSLELPGSSQSRTAAAMVEPDANDPVTGFAVYWQAGNTIAAHRVLEEATLDAHSTTTSEVLRLRAALAAHDTDWLKAWQTLAEYLRYTGQVHDL